MARISYDPVKDRLALFLRKLPGLRRLFYFFLDLLFLRSWYIRRLIREKGSVRAQTGKWKILDAGSGFGQYDRFLLANFKQAEVTALDIKDEYLEDCRLYFKEEIENGRIRFLKQDLLTLELEETFDMIICIDVLEHIERDRDVIERLADLLNPGGNLLMHSPSNLSEKDAGEGEESFVDEHARSGYSIDEISGKFRDAGLEVESAAYTYGPLGHFSWVLTIKYPMLWVNRMGGWALLILLVYYPILIPLSLFLNRLDLALDNKRGNGVWALARKPESEPENTP